MTLEFNAFCHKWGKRTTAIDAQKQNIGRYVRLSGKKWRSLFGEICIQTGC